MSSDTFAADRAEPVSPACRRCSSFAGWTPRRSEPCSGALSHQLPSGKEQSWKFTGGPDRSKSVSWPIRMVLQVLPSPTPWRGSAQVEFMVQTCSAPALCTALHSALRGNTGDHGICMTASSLDPTQCLTQIKDSANSPPVGQLRDGSVSLETLIPPKVIRRNSSLGW